MKSWTVKFSTDAGYREYIYAALNAIEAQRLAINDGVAWGNILSVTLA